MASLLRNVQFIAFGNKNFGKDGYARAAAQFDNSVMERKLTGRVCLVTGANQGLGFKVSEELAKRGATLLMVCRNAERGQVAVKEIQDKTGNADVHLKVCDVSSMSSIKQLADELKQQGQPVHVLVNNAGVMVHERTASADGLDINYATNTVGSWLLTRLLEPLLEKSAPSKVIFVSSGGQYTQKLHPEVLRADGPSKGSYDGTVVYAQDKRRQVAICEQFAAAWKDKGIHSYAMHPGWTTTEGVKKSIPGFYNFFKDKFRELDQGSDTIVYLALQDDAKLEQGGFYLDRKPQIKHLSLGFTKYSKQDVDKLMSNLEGVAKQVL